MRTWTLLLLFLVSCSACAGSGQVNGFLAQGIIRAENSNFVSDHSGNIQSLTELGINGTYRISDRLRIAGQVNYLKGGNRYPEGARIDYLFIDWRVLMKPNWQLSVQTGRYKNYHWLYSSTRDVPHTRTTIVLPQSVYFDVFRDVALGSDGVALISSHNGHWGEVDVQWSLGSSPISAAQQSNLLGPSIQGKLEQKFTHQASVYMRPLEQNWQFGISLLDSDFDFNSDENNGFLDGQATSQRAMLHMTYHAERVELAMELMQERVVYQGLFYPTFYNDTQAQGGYVQLRYLASPAFSFTARVDLFDLNKDDRSGRQLFKQTGMPAYFAYMDTATLGVSYVLSRNCLMMAEWHRVKGRGRLAPVLTPALTANQGEYWSMFALQFSHWF